MLLESKSIHLPFGVMKANKRTLKFHRAAGAVEIGEDEENYYFEITISNFYSMHERRVEK